MASPVDLPDGEVLAVSSSVSPAEQAATAQRRLEALYQATYNRLWPWRDTLMLVQEVLVWRKPVPTIALYLFVHWMFVHFAHYEGNLLSMLGILLFVFLVVDLLYRAANSTKKEGSVPTNPPNPRLKRRTTTGPVREVPFETAIMNMHTPRQPHTLIPFDVVCLKIAQLLVLGETMTLALRYWSTHQTLVFSMVVAIPGLALALLGRYIPTAVLLYIIVMGVIVSPYIEYSQMVPKITNYIHTHFPTLLLRGQAIVTFLKSFAIAKDDESGDFDFTLEENERVREEEREEGGGGGGEGEGEREVEREGEGERDINQDVPAPKHYQDADPDMSIAQDSILGLQPNAFEGFELDSLSSSSLLLEPGAFPSITNLDAPSTSKPRGRNLTPSSRARMPVIGEDQEGWKEEEEEEEEEGEGDWLEVAAENIVRDQLDPLTDSLDMEFGFEFTDTASRAMKSSRSPSSRNHQHWRDPRYSNPRHLTPLAPPHPLSISQSIYSQPSPQTQRDPILPQPSSVPPHNDSNTPPPSYDEVMAAQHNFPQDGPPGNRYPGTPSGGLSPGFIPHSDAVPHSSTPLAGIPLQDNGMRLRERGGSGSTSSDPQHNLYPNLDQQ